LSANGNDRLKASRGDSVMKVDSTYLGHFQIGGKEYAGQLVVDGEKSLLEIYGDDFLHITERK
jgi:hypothetical protein